MSLDELDYDLVPELDRRTADLQRDQLPPADARNPHVIELVAVYKATNNLSLSVVLEIRESDVHLVIRVGIFMDIHKRSIVSQMLIGLKHLHSRQLIHCGLKPSNSSVENCDFTIKLCDFGLARTFAEGDHTKAVMTNYGSTQWHRAPELKIGSNHCHEGVDMSAVGRIVGELYGGKWLLVGTSTLDQMDASSHSLGRRPRPTSG